MYMMLRARKNTRLHWVVTIGKTTDMIKFAMKDFLSLAWLTAWSGVEHSHCVHFCWSWWQLPILCRSGLERGTVQTCWLAGTQHGLWDSEPHGGNNESEGQSSPGGGSTSLVQLCSTVWRLDMHQCPWHSESWL